MEPVVKTIELPGRVTLSYAEQGDPAGVPMILLHGVSDSWRSFDPVLPHLPQNIRAIALSQRGHGDSGRPAIGYHASDFSNDVAGLCDALGIDAAVIVGHSMGATNAQRFAIDHPERTRGLVLMASFAGYTDKPEVVELCKTTVPQLSDPVDPGFVRGFQESTLARPISPAYLDLVVNESLKLPARVWHEIVDGFLEDPCTAELGLITAPTLILWGSKDTFCSRDDQDHFVSEIEGSRLVVYDGAGHALHWEEPERVAADLVAFVESLGA